jgi:hypothetical protein
MDIDADGCFRARLISVNARDSASCQTLSVLLIGRSEMSMTSNSGLSNKEELRREHADDARTVVFITGVLIVLVVAIIHLAAAMR